jgi:hypothetical protein
MLRSVALVAVGLALCARAAAADAVATNVRALEESAAFKVRIAAALSLAKSRDARAVIALATALRRTDEAASIRNVAALALEKMIDARTPEDAREIGLAALAEVAAATAGDARVRASSARALRSLSGLRRPPGPRGPRPAVFINIDSTTDPSRQLSPDTSSGIARLLRRAVETTGYVTSWPGGLPTAAELASHQSRAFILASTVKKVEITRVGAQTQIACTVAVRVAPWHGKDGGERWEANRAASASGSAKAMTGNRERDVQSGLRDCVEAVAEDVTARQVLPFLRQLAVAK